MPARIVDELNDDGTERFSDDSALAELVAQPKEDSEPKPDRLETEDVPEKYRGKSAHELLKIVQDQESYIGRQGQELGELRGQVGTLRGLVDKSLALRDGSIGREDVGTEDDLNDDDFLTTPRDAVRKTVQRETKETNDRLARLEQREAAIDFARRHPTAEKDIEDPAFKEFVQKSRVRSRLAQEAFADPSDIDFDAAEELWELWEDYQTLTPRQQQATDESETSASAPASQEVSPKAPPTMLKQGSSGDVGGSTKPVYSQAALNRLQNENPDLYWANDTQRKINEAYAEGRVVQDA